MPRIVAIADRASETITLRLTKEQKRLLEQVASADGTTATETVRRLLYGRARELGFAATESGAARSSGVPEIASTPVAPADRPTRTSAARVDTFGDLAARFQATFEERGEGTRRELAATLRFLTEPAGVAREPLVPSELPLAELTPQRIAALRAELLAADLRLSRKNLHLTYLRMMLHYALKHREIAIDANPGVALRPFTAVEAGESWVPPPADPIDPE